jgi:hypothetical protein
VEQNCEIAYALLDSLLQFTIGVMLERALVPTIRSLAIVPFIAFEKAAVRPIACTKTATSLGLRIET